MVGRGFPAVRVRHEMLREALEIIRLLRQGGYRSYDGKHLQLEDARVFDLPEQLPLIAVAASGRASATLAAELGDGLFVTEPKPEVLTDFRTAGGTGPGYAEAPVAWASDEATAVAAVLEKSRWALTGWKVMAELPNPVNFDAASATVREDDVLGQFACGPDVERHVEVVRQFTDAGYDRIVLQNAGPDPDGFVDFFRSTLAPRLRALEVAKPSAVTAVTGAVTGAVKAAVS